MSSTLNDLDLGSSHPPHSADATRQCGRVPGVVGFRLRWTIVSTAAVDLPLDDRLCNDRAEGCGRSGPLAILAKGRRMLHCQL